MTTQRLSAPNELRTISPSTDDPVSEAGSVPNLSTPDAESITGGVPDGVPSRPVAGKSRRKTRVADWPEPERRAYMVEQHREVNCPCQGDIDRCAEHRAIQNVRDLAADVEVFARSWDNAMEELAYAQAAALRARDRYVEAARKHAEAVSEAAS